MSNLASVADALKVWAFHPESSSTSNSTEHLSLLSSFKPPERTCHCAAWNHTNQVLAVGGAEGTVHLVHAENGQLLSSLQVYSQEAKHMISQNHDDPKRCQPRTVSFSGNSRYLATATNEVLQLWDLKKRQIKTTFSQGHRQPITDCLFLPDGEIASADEAGVVRIWNPKTHQSSIEMKADSSAVNRDDSPQKFSPAAKSPNKTFAVTAIDNSRMAPNLIAAGYADGALVVWDAEKYKSTRKLIQCHSGSLSDLSYSPKNPRLVATVGMDGRVALIDTGIKSSGEPSAVIDLGEKLNCISFHEDAIHCAVAASNGRLLIYDWRNIRRPVASVSAHGLRYPVQCLAFQSVCDKQPINSTTSSSPARIIAKGEISKSTPSPSQISQDNAGLEQRQKELGFPHAPDSSDRIKAKGLISNIDTNPVSLSKRGAGSSDSVDIGKPYERAQHTQRSAAVASATTSSDPSFSMSKDVDGVGVQRSVADRLGGLSMSNAKIESVKKQDDSKSAGQTNDSILTTEDPYSLYNSYEGYRDDSRALDEHHPGRLKTYETNTVNSNVLPTARKPIDKSFDRRHLTVAKAAVARERSEQIKPIDRSAQDQIQKESFDEISKIAADSIARINEQQDAIDRAKMSMEIKREVTSYDVLNRVDTRNAISDTNTAISTPTVERGSHNKLKSGEDRIHRSAGYYDYDPFSAATVDGAVNETHDAHDEEGQLELSSLKQILRPITRNELDDSLQLLRYDIHREVQDILKEQVRQFAMAKDETAELIGEMSRQLAELLRANKELRAENEYLRRIF